MKERWTRRDLIKLAGASLLAPLAAACAPPTDPKVATLEARITQLEAEKAAQPQPDTELPANVRVVLPARVIQATEEAMRQKAQPSPTPEPIPTAKTEPTPPPKPTREKPKIYELTQTATPKPEIKIENLKLLWQRTIKRATNEVPYRPRSQEFPYPPTISSLTITQDALFFTTSEDGKEPSFAGFEIRTGKKLWPEKTGFNGIPIGAWEDTIWVYPSVEMFSTRGNVALYGFSIKDGKEKFNIPFVLPLESLPFAHQDKVFFLKSKDLSYSTHFLMELDNTTGKITERAIINAPNQSISVYAATRDYLILRYYDSNRTHEENTYNPTLGALNKNTWERLMVQSSLFGKPMFWGAVRDNKTANELLVTLYRSTERSGVEKRSIAALRRSGKMLNIEWELPLGNLLWLSDNLLLYTPEIRGPKIVALSPQTGLVLWWTEKTRSGEIYAIEGNNIYLSTNNGVGLFDKEQDKIIWEFDRWIKRKDGSKEMSGLTDAIILGNTFVFEHNRNLVFLNKETGEESRPSIQLDWWPVNFHQAGKFLIVEGRDQIAVLG